MSVHHEIPTLAVYVSSFGLRHQENLLDKAIRLHGKSEIVTGFIPGDKSSRDSGTSI